MSEHGRLNESELDRLQAVANNATQGEWLFGKAIFSDNEEESHYVVAQQGRKEKNLCRITSRRGRADAEHIATFDPLTVIGLIGNIRSLRGQIRVFAAVIEAEAKAIEDFTSDGSSFYEYKKGVVDGYLEAAKIVRGERTRWAEQWAS